MWLMYDSLSGAKQCVDKCLVIPPTYKIRGYTGIITSSGLAVNVCARNTSFHLLCLQSWTSAVNKVHHINTIHRQIHTHATHTYTHSTHTHTHTYAHTHAHTHTRIHRHKLKENVTLKFILSDTSEHTTMFFTRIFIINVAPYS